MNSRAMSLIEIVLSLVILAVAALAISATLGMVSGPKVRSPSGSLELQAASLARQTLEELKNHVSTDSTIASDLSDNSYTAPCATPVGTPCGAGQVHSTAALSGDLLANSAVRAYTVWDISDGTGVGAGVAYKKVTATVTWTDPS